MRIEHQSHLSIRQRIQLLHDFRQVAMLANVVGDDVFVDVDKVGALLQ